MNQGYSSYQNLSNFGTGAFDPNLRYANNLGAAGATGQGFGADFGGVIGGGTIDPNQYGASTASIGVGGYTPRAQSFGGFGQGQGAQGAMGGNTLIREQPGMSGMQMGVAGAQIAGTMLNGYLGLKQLGLAKKQQRMQEQQFQANYTAQKNSFNAQLEAKIASASASNPQRAAAMQAFGEKYRLN